MMDNGFLKGLPKGGKDCDCWQCVSDRKEHSTHMILCDICGNKRCPHASNHRLDCTHSNATGQNGSVYK